MKYTKPALSYEQQAQHLLDQGLIADKSILVDRLKMVNYYRLSAYWYNFKVIDPQTKKEGFSPDTKFDMVWRRYTFDRELRLLIMGAIEHVEVAILRTRLVSQFALTHGPFGYVDLANFNPKFYSDNHARLLGELETAINTSNEEFIGRFRRKYTGESNLPLWIAVEVMTFGQLFTMFRFLDHSDLQPIAREFNLYPPVMVSWLHTLLFIRNTCAHHARLWNREIPISPLIPDEKHQPEWHSPVQFDNKRMFTVLTLLHYLLRFIDPDNDWQSRLEDLLLAYPDIPLDAMGIPRNWKDCSLWER